MKLYNISEEEIEQIFSTGEKYKDVGEKIYFIKNIPGKDLPVKVVCKMIENDYLIITCYPLKKGIGK